MSDVATCQRGPAQGNGQISRWSCFHEELAGDGFPHCPVLIYNLLPVLFPCNQTPFTFNLTTIPYKIIRQVEKTASQAVSTAFHVPQFTHCRGEKKRGGGGGGGGAGGGKENLVISNFPVQSSKTFGRWWWRKGKRKTNGR